MATKKENERTAEGEPTADDKKPSKRKGLVLPVRVTIEQRKLLAEAAEKAGLDISSWLRSIGLERARKDLGRP